MWLITYTGLFLLLLPRHGTCSEKTEIGEACETKSKCFITCNFQMPSICLQVKLFGWPLFNEYEFRFSPAAFFQSWRSLISTCLGRWLDGQQKGHWMCTFSMGLNTVSRICSWMFTCRSTWLMSSPIRYTRLVLMTELDFCSIKDLGTSVFYPVFFRCNQGRNAQKKLDFEMETANIQKTHEKKFQAKRNEKFVKFKQGKRTKYRYLKRFGIISHSK